ncbi:hypothetical protein D3C73_1371510 [compost metagenome]
MKLIRWLIGVVEALIRFLIKTVEVCFIRPAVALYKFLMAVLGFLVTIAMFLYKVVVQLFYPVRFLLRLLMRAIRPYWKVPEWLRKLWQRILRWLKR